MLLAGIVVLCVCVCAIIPARFSTRTQLSELPILTRADDVHIIDCNFGDDPITIISTMFVSNRPGINKYAPAN